MEAVFWSAAFAACSTHPAIFFLSVAAVKSSKEEEEKGREEAEQAGGRKMTEKNKKRGGRDKHLSVRKQILMPIIVVAGAETL